MKHHKNKKFIDPRYFMDEKVDDEATTPNQLDEGDFLKRVGQAASAAKKAFTGQHPETQPARRASSPGGVGAPEGGLDPEDAIRFKVRARKFRDETNQMLKQLGILKRIRPAIKGAEAVGLLSSEQEALFGHNFDLVVAVIEKEQGDMATTMGGIEEAAGRGSEGAFVPSDHILHLHSLKAATEIASYRPGHRIGADTARDIARKLASSHNGWLTQAHALTEKWLSEYDDLLSDEAKQGLAKWMKRLEAMGQDIRKRLQSGWDQQIFEGKTRKLTKSQLKKIIKEEISTILREDLTSQGFVPGDPEGVYKYEKVTGTKPVRIKDANIPLDYAVEWIRHNYQGEIEGKAGIILQIFKDSVDKDQIVNPDLWGNPAVLPPDQAKQATIIRNRAGITDAEGGMMMDLHDIHMDIMKSYNQESANR
jgi:hypothetical protein